MSAAARANGRVKRKTLGMGELRKRDKARCD
jgi:hypothetical protein